MKERGNWWNLPGKHNGLAYNLGPRKSLTISPHIDIPLYRRWQLRIEGSYTFFVHRRLTPEESHQLIEDVRGILKPHKESEEEA
jgi:hypothetical protein